MSRVWAIAWKNIYLTYRDRNLLLVMLATPLALSLIIGLAFGGGSGGTITFENIPVAFVNLDAGTTQNNTRINYGTTIQSILAPSGETSDTNEIVCALTNPNSTTSNSNTSLDTLLDVTLVADAETARQGVADGKYTASIVIPADFSQTLASIGSDAPTSPSTVEVFGNSGSPIQATVVKSITESLMTQMVTGNIAVTSTINTLVERAQSNLVFGAYFATLSASNTWQPNFDCAFTPDSNTVTIQREAITLVQEQSDFVQILLTVGTAQAVFFALFTGQFGFLSIYDDRKNGTLPRLMVAPVTQREILGGYLVGVFVSVLVQLVTLMLCLTLVASVLEGKAQFIWGSNLLHLGLIVISITTAVCGVGLIVVAVARTPQQAQTIGSILNTFMAALGGTFGFSLPQEVSLFSPIWWSRDALYRLSTNNVDVGLHVLVLLGMGGLLFAVGLWIFNKREVMVS
jgi:ABC-type Na+ efflux pump permease subunit